MQGNQYSEGGEALGKARPGCHLVSPRGWMAGELSMGTPAGWEQERYVLSPLRMPMVFFWAVWGLLRNPPKMPRWEPSLLEDGSWARCRLRTANNSLQPRISQLFVSSPKINGTFIRQKRQENSSTASREPQLPFLGISDSEIQNPASGLHSHSLACTQSRSEIRCSHASEAQRCTGSPEPLRRSSLHLEQSQQLFTLNTNTQESICDISVIR